MRKSKEPNNTKITIAVVILICLGAVTGLLLGGRYIAEKLLTANEMTASDMASLIAGEFTITDDEVTYMKSLSFNDMEIDPINHRLLDSQDWGALSTTISNVFVVTPLDTDEIVYCENEESADFLGYEVGTALDGMWLLNGRIDAGSFVEAQRDNIYRYTVLDSDEIQGLEERKPFGTYSSDAWGAFITGYAPLYTTEGTFVGLLGVDMALDQYQASAQNMSFIMLLVCLVTALVIAALFLFFFMKHVHASRALYGKQERKYLQMIDKMGALDDDTLITKGRHNLTQNIVLYYQKKDGGDTGIESEMTYDQAMKHLADTAVSPAKAQEMKTLFSRSALIADYAAGHVEGSFEYTRYTTDDMIIWSLVKYSLFEEPDTRDIIAFIYTFDVSERMLEKHMLTRISENEYDLIGLLDIQTHHYSLKKIPRSYHLLNRASEGDFEENVHRWIVDRVLPVEQDRVLQQFQIEYIVGELDRSGTYYTTYSILDEEQQFHRKRYLFCYLDDTHETILFHRSDITEMYNREQEQMCQIENALQQAREANKAKSAFLSRMSHDIRTPMNTIVNLTKIVASEIDNPAAAREDLKKIETSNEFLLSLVNDILDMSRIENQSIELHPERYSYREFINYIDSTFESMAKQKDIEFVFEKGKENVDIMIDKLRFNQMCSNLIANAIKYTPQGGRVCFQMLHGEIKDGILPCDMYIIDNGIGMSREFQARMFESFAQEERTFKTVEGTGLGLAIVKEIVDLLGGTIEVMSEVDVGTTFHVHIGMKIATGRAQPELEELSDISCLDGRRILLAEDHPLNQEIARRLLAHVGIEVIVADNGQQAVELFRQNPDKYDAILMDMRMPVLDGLGATRSIRALAVERAKNIPIIAMTANAFAEDREESREAGLNAHLSKPIDPKTLYETLAAWIEKI